MKKMIIAVALLAASFSAPAQSRLSNHELSINAFRNPSIGLEYRYKHLSVHSGYYPTNFTSGITTEFIRTGVTLWFLSFGKRENPSSFYSSVSYARGLTREYKQKNAVMPEIGVRLMIYKGLNFRLGVNGTRCAGRKLQDQPHAGA